MAHLKTFSTLIFLKQSFEKIPSVFNYNTLPLLLQCFFANERQHFNNCTANAET